MKRATKMITLALLTDTSTIIIGSVVSLILRISIPFV